MVWLIIFSALAFVFAVGAFVYCISNLVGLIWARGVPFVSLSRKRLRILSDLIKLNPGDKIVDLGCGDGRVLRMFEKQGVEDLTGYEVNFWAYLLAKIENKLAKSKSKIYFRNFKKADLSRYNTIFCYLMPGCLNSLKEKFDRELKPGTKIISFVFQIKNWRQPEIIYLDKNKKGKIFIYKI